MDLPVLSDQQKLTVNNFSVDIGCRIEELRRAIADRDG